MKLTTLALSALLVAACVPASDKRPPAGAAGFTTVPSAAARGEPLSTADGWTVTFTKVIVQASVDVYPLDGADTENGRSGSNDIWLWDGSKPARIFTRELGVGPWSVDVRLMSHFVGDDFEKDSDQAPINVDVSLEDEARFQSAADSGASGQGPNVLVNLHAEKSGRTIGLDLSFYGMMGPAATDRRAQRNVRANSVALGPLAVEPERLLESHNDHLLRFEPIAAADKNGDGTVTAAELLDALSPDQGIAKDYGVSQTSLQGALVARCGNILVPRE